jgi:ABC-type nitrate/sulfonate/bicarbonate transport system permease component
MKRYAAGFAIAAAIGIALGLLVGAFPAARRTLGPFLECLRAVPAIAIVPAAILILGFGDASRIAVIAFGLCFPILVNTAEGVRGIPLEVRDTASMLHVGRVERAARIYLPAALPSIMAGLRIAVSLGLVLVIVSEFVGEQNGIGYYLIIKQSEFDYPALYAGILFLGLLGYVLNRLFLLVERRVLAWHYRAAGD